MEKIRKKNALVIGAGSAAKILILDFRNSRSCNYDDNPAKKIDIIGIVDDDVSKIGTDVDGIKVLGTTQDIEKICAEYKINLIYFAIPSCGKENRKRILDICANTSLPVRVLPYLSEFSDAIKQQSTIMPFVRDLNINDLLGREPIDLDKAPIKKFIKGKRCLVTGGGGSIGGELVNQIASCEPELLIILDVYENCAYDVQQNLCIEYGNSLNLKTIITTICDYDKMESIFAKYKPDLVFHAAAHKHVPLMETVPDEAVKNNVFGSINVIDLAEKYGVQKFVLVSTDKAVNPTNVMGATKRCCEQYIEAKVMRGSKTEFVITRFGNVLGSHGSVIPLFMNQIKKGRPLTITDPKMRRFFMTIPEAVSLLLTAAAMANGGEIFVLDMGDDVKIVDLARNLLILNGITPVEGENYKFTGLRPGEKLYEELFYNLNDCDKTSHKKILIERKKILTQEQINAYIKDMEDKLVLLKEAAETTDAGKTVEALKDIVPTFKPANEKNN